MKQLTMTINAKGGVGKSMFSVQFMNFLEERGIPHVAIDSDTENATLTRYHPKAEFLDLDDRREIDHIFEKLDATNYVVVDGRAASTDIFLQYFQEMEIFNILKQLNTRLTLAMPINHEADSIEQVRVVVDTVGSNASYVVIKNQSHSDEFGLWEGSKIRERVKTLGGQEMIMPKLADWLVTALNMENMPVGRAVEQGDFSSMDKQRLRNWQKKFNSELENALYLLIPS